LQHNDPVPGDVCDSLSKLPPEAASIVHEARRAVLSTLDRFGKPHAVPVCFAVVRDELVTAIDHKPKSKRRAARLANVERNPAAAMLFDRWDEDWRRLGWVLVRGVARIEPPGTGSSELVRRYPQYSRHPPDGEVIALSPVRVTWWLWDESSPASL
jgi:PPOX class probable F420-dependent enzyme